MPGPNESTQARPQVIESASATTSEDNANSGTSAYVIVAIGLGLVILACTGVASCIAGVATSAAMHYEREYDYGDDYGYGFDDDSVLDILHNDYRDDFNLYSNPRTQENIERLLEELQERRDDGMGSRSLSF